MNQRVYGTGTRCRRGTADPSGAAPQGMLESLQDKAAQ